MEVCLSVCPSVYDYDQRQYYYNFDATKANYKHILQNAVKISALLRLTTYNLMLQEHNTDIFFKFLLIFSTETRLTNTISMLQEHTTDKIFKFLLKSQRKYGLLLLFRCYKSIIWTNYTNFCWIFNWNTAYYELFSHNSGNIVHMYIIILIFNLPNTIHYYLNRARTR